MISISICNWDSRTIASDQNYKQVWNWEEYFKGMSLYNMNPVMAALVLKDNGRKRDKRSWWLGGAVQVWTAINYSVQPVLYTST